VIVNTIASRRSSAIARAAGLVVSLVCLGAVVWWALHQPAPPLPSTPAELWAAAAAIAVYGLATALRSERWLSLLHYEGGSPSRTDAYGLTLVGFMGNNVLPARGGDAMRIYLMPPRAGVGYRSVIGTLVAERVLDAAVLLTLFVVLGYGVLSGIDTPSGDALIIAAAIVLAIAVAIIVVLSIGRRNDTIRRLVAFLRPIAAATAGLRGRHGARMLAATFLIWLVEAATYLLVSRAVGLEMEAIEALYLVALASVFVLLPSGPSYAGTLDAAILFGVAAIGGDGSEALAYLIALRFVLFVPITISGLTVTVLRYGWGGRRTGTGEGASAGPTG
jgi:uncharacterized protein (TIRG00374 family)